MPAQDNATLARNLYEAFNKGDIDGIASLYASSTAYDNPFSPQPLTSPDAVRECQKTGVGSRFVGPVGGAVLV